MSDTTEAIKKYWPWVAGGVIGLVLISYMRGGSSSGGTATVGGLSASESAQYGLQAASIAANRDIALAKTTGENAAAFLAAQGVAAQGVGEGVSQLLGVLQLPTITAINAGAAENVATINGAVAAQVGAFNAQASTLNSMAAGNLALAQTQATASNALSMAVQASAASIGQQQAGFQLAQGKDNSSATSTIGKLAAAYFGVAA